MQRPEGRFSRLLERLQDSQGSPGPSRPFKKAVWKSTPLPATRLPELTQVPLLLLLTFFFFFCQLMLIISCGWQVDIPFPNNTID